MQHREEEMQGLKKEYMEHEMSMEQIEMLKLKINQAKKENVRDRNKVIVQRFASVAAVIVAGFIILPNTSATVAHAMEQIPIIGQLVKAVTFRDYEYEDERHRADLEIPQLEVEYITDDKVVQENINKTMDEINAEILEISDEIIAQFETYLAEEEGYQEFIVESEVLATTEDYFTLKLICYQGAGSGYQWNYYYTIDLNTGERLQLKDIFEEGVDYITPISENIKEQMQAQMDADEMVHYWLHDEIEEWNFKAITDETSFYLNDKDNVVIGFDEGEVAPMYMGVVEFEIPAEILENIRK